MIYIIGIILLFFIIKMLFGERIKQWAQRRMLEKMEDSFRARMGMPSAKEERRRRRRTEKQQQRRQKDSQSGSRRNQWQHSAHPESSNQSMGDVIIPREYAEDVEFVEYKEFTITTTTSTVTDSDGSGHKTTFVTESQVTDVEYVEIKTEK
ncbi:MAG: hypothetical protein K2H35_07295 [Muribaculaceae bacterium]|nr:hypothetical protein [Muribaculaceae bacterium]